MEVGIKRVIHVMRLMWKHNDQEEDWVFLLVEGQKTCNKENQTEVLWAVQLE